MGSRRSRRLIPPLVAAALLTAACGGRSFDLTVVGGSGSGTYAAHDTVRIAANPAPAGFRFERWIGDTKSLEDTDAATTRITMPARSVRVAALIRPVVAPAPEASVARYGRLELEFRGPFGQSLGGSFNPFRLEADVVFRGPRGESAHAVPAYYDGDGRGGLDGRVWKVRFSPDVEGIWTWSVADSGAGLRPSTGSFRVTAPVSDDGPFAARGGLHATGGPYLVFADGTPWLKGGADDPEDFLANRSLATWDARHQAIDKLAGLGVNSLYLVTMNVGGDGRNVWPWIGATEKEAKRNHRRFDVAKLAEWERLFAHMQRRGLLIELVLEDDSAWTGYDRALYYRELVARFAHHRGLVWYLAEEFNENHDAGAIRGFAALLRSLDPYDHPIAVHHAGDSSALRPFLGDPNIDVAGIQTKDRPQNATAVNWYRESGRAGRRLVISFDETGKLGPAERDKARHILWSVYLAGANFELHGWPVYEGRFTYADYADMLADVGRARRFLGTGFPLEEMEPHNDLVRDGSHVYVFAKPGEVYLVYLPKGTRSTSIDFLALRSPARLRWFDPATGDMRDAGPLDGGAVRRVGPSPFRDDAVAWIARAGDRDG